MPERPGGTLAKKPLHFFYIVDCSGSMHGKKMETLNYAIRESIKPMQDVAEENPQAEIWVRVVKFSDGAQWQVAQPVEIHNFTWTDLDADGITDMGEAMKLVSQALDVNAMPARGLPPVLVLVSDGQPTDDFAAGLKSLMDQPWGKKAVRISVAIGDGTDVDLDVLQRFNGNPEVKPLVATNVQDLVKKIKWASTVPLKSASAPATRVADGAGAAAGNVPIPAPPIDVMPATAADVF